MMARCKGPAARRALNDSALLMCRILVVHLSMRVDYVDGLTESRIASVAVNEMADRIESHANKKAFVASCPRRMC
jgi:hypothetical protein